MKGAGGPSANDHQGKVWLQKGAPFKASKCYKLTVVKGSAHMLRALRAREVSGSRDSTQVLLCCAQISRVIVLTILDEGEKLRHQVPVQPFAPCLTYVSR